METLSVLFPIYLYRHLSIIRVHKPHDAISIFEDQDVRGPAHDVPPCFWYSGCVLLGVNDRAIAPHKARSDQKYCCADVYKPCFHRFLLRENTTTPTMIQDTSLHAFRKVTISKSQDAVLKIIRAHPEGLTDAEINHYLGWTINRVTPHRGELLNEKGLIYYAGRLTSKPARTKQRLPYCRQREMKSPKQTNSLGI
jgi:hypothetical protein